MSALPGFLDRRLVVVTGKGGVGRTTVSCALALAAASHGRRACVVEMSGAVEAAAVFGVPGRSYAPREVAPGVDLISLTAAECLDDFGRRKLGLGRLGGKLVNNRVTRAFLEAVPGLHDLLQLGKLENLLSEPLPGESTYDVAILDAPATGHGLTLLGAARSMTQMTRVGPFHDLATIIADFLADADRTALVLTTIPEALPVLESLELVEALRHHGGALAGVVVNQLRAEPVPETPPWSTVRAALIAAGRPWAEITPVLDASVHRWDAQDAALTALDEHLDVDCPVVGAPWIEAPDPLTRAAGIADVLLEAP